jgi:outer membrane receptor protein involved in Fe transport
MGELISDFGLNYTFNPVEAIETKDETGIINRQLNYVPQNMGTAFFSTSFKNWKISTDSQYTGTRFTDDFGNKLPAFFILNGGIHYLINSGKHKINVTLSSQNILNTNYQSQQYYAMPGRSFWLGLTYDLNNL